MEPAEAFGGEVFRPRQSPGQFGDPDCRCVRQEKLLPAAEPVKFAVELLFHFRLFDDRLQNHLGAVQVGRLAGNGKKSLNPPARLGRLVRFRFGTPRELAGELRGKPTGDGGARLGSEIVEENRNSGTQKRGGDGASHQAAAGNSERYGRRSHGKTLFGGDCGRRNEGYNDRCKLSVFGARLTLPRP